MPTYPWQLLAGEEESVDDSNHVRQKRLAAAILRTIAYSDLFDYPLTLEELHRYLEAELVERATLQTVIDIDPHLRQQVEFTEGYYHLTGRSHLVNLRHKRALKSAELWSKAVRHVDIIRSFPFVKMVALTGSLAMSNVDNEADVDLLIVTAHRRVWLVRLLCVALVRWARQHGTHLCPNFVLSESALLFERKTLYTAREMSQMVPLAGGNVYHLLRQTNQWTERFLPNSAGPPGILPLKEIETGTLSRLLSWCLSGRLGDWLDAWEMRRKIKRFEAQLSNEEAIFSQDYCKGHFEAHEQRTLSAFAARVATFQATRDD